MDFFLKLAVSSPPNGTGFFSETWLVLLYLGPETIMPLASVIAAVLGFILIFWRYIVNFIKKIFKRSKDESLVSPSEPSDAETYKDPLDN